MQKALPNLSGLALRNGAPSSVPTDGIEDELATFFRGIPRGRVPHAYWEKEYLADLKQTDPRSAARARHFAYRMAMAASETYQVQLVSNADPSYTDLCVAEFQYGENEAQRTDTPAVLPCTDGRRAFHMTKRVETVRVVQGHADMEQPYEALRDCAEVFKTNVRAPGTMKLTICHDRSTHECFVHHAYAPDTPNAKEVLAFTAYLYPIEGPTGAGTTNAQAAATGGAFVRMLRPKARCRPRFVPPSPDEHGADERSSESSSESSSGSSNSSGSEPGESDSTSSDEGSSSGSESEAEPEPEPEVAVEVEFAPKTETVVYTLSATNMFAPNQRIACDERTDLRLKIKDYDGTTDAERGLRELLDAARGETEDTLRAFADAVRDRIDDEAQLELTLTDVRATTATVAGHRLVGADDVPTGDNVGGAAVAVVDYWLKFFAAHSEDETAHVQRANATAPWNFTPVAVPENNLGGCDDVPAVPAIQLRSPV